MFSPEFDPLGQLNQHHSELIRLNKTLDNLITQNQNMSELMVQYTESHNSLINKFNQLLRDHKQLQIKLALIDTK